MKTNIGVGAALTRFHSCDGDPYAKIAVMMRTGKVFWFGLLALAALGGCKKGSPLDNPQYDRQTEARREQDCADPQWKAANLGLWYNICSGEQH
jgi:hypothetical protein